MLGNKRGNKLTEYIPDYVVFDLETTGISPYNDSIIEISGVKVKAGKVVDTFSTLVNPRRAIPYGATAVNGITDDMVEGESYIEEVLPVFNAFVEDFVLVGHNIACFDMKFIWKAAEELLGQTFTNDYIDTLPMARKRLPQLSHHRLVDLAEYYELSTEGAHRALNDCIMNQKCYEFLQQEYVKNPPKRCPHCGGELKRRNGRYGEFYGCLEFPKCRYTENI
ncbi:MAG: topoisomerase DNA-binding C4 zinc finger domain-containing protein [Lachnospiraceae bacterium]|nr:topoisomerase DNA-binding C4 zinc finger domain-containing protein [Lachnospiraceae bacterium]